MKSKLVVIGNGMAGVRCVEEIIKLAPERFEITIIGSEPYTNYNRIMLSKVLQGNTSIDDITINSQQWYDDNGIKLYKGETAVSIDKSLQVVTTSEGRVIAYDRLILATGSNPFMLPLPGADKPGVTAFRDIKDCHTMMEASKKHTRAAVIGGGLLGLEAARGLLNLGMQVTVVHIHKYLMERQLDETAAEMLKKELEEQGMHFLLEKNSERILGRRCVEGLQFTDGSRLATDLVVFAVGIRPNVKLAAESGIDTNRAIVVNDRLETSAPGIYAVGECAEHRGMAYGLVAPLYEQGKVLAKVICDEPTDGYAGSVLYSQLKVSGVEVFSAGEIKDSGAEAAIKWYDGVRRTYKKITVINNRIAGAVLFGDSSEGNKLLAYIKSKADISVLEKEAQGGSGAGDEELVAAMPDSETVCSCNGVTKGAIVKAVCEQGLKTAEEVRDCTRASSSCGGCKPLVEAVLSYSLASGSGAVAEKETICDCTSLSHEEAKRAIYDWGYWQGGWEVSGLKAAMKRLGWHNEEGCAICQPAVRYYIMRIAGGGAASGAAVRELGDGTYSVQPRAYGGVLNANLLRKAADVMERYNLPLVKLTAQSRLELMGVTDQQLPAVAGAFSRNELGGWYAAHTASVVTCGGLHHESSALRDSVRMGAYLERELETAVFPAEIAIGVSSSPLHRAATPTKDVGLAGAPSGWELYIGGSDGSREPLPKGGAPMVKQAQLLGAELDDAKASEMSLALLQWYRASANYGQSMGEWLEEHGLIAVRERLFDVVGRQLLLAELHADLKGEWPTNIAVGVTGDE